MNTLDTLLHAWNWNPPVLIAAAAVTAGYFVAFRGEGRPASFVAAVAVVLLTLLSPLDALADGVLFSAHMVQHIFLLLIAPALLLFSLPAGVGLQPGSRLRRVLPYLGWAGGVGSMWFWHVPQLCSAAAASGTVHAVQTLSLLVLGTAFWWPVFAPRPSDRLAPGFGIGYLFTACLACTALGMILTLTPVQACPIFRAPLAAGSAWAAIRAGVTAERDQQIGGLLMWVPMCLVYVAGIVIELFRWLGGRDPHPAWHGEARS
jgi:cytochrome c oxidase assembly factor CtaG